MPIGLFIDASYVYKAFKGKMDYLKLREYVVSNFKDEIDEAYYFSADDYPPVAEKLHYFLERPYPQGAGFRMKIYTMSKKLLFWPDQLGGQPVTHPTMKNVQYEVKSQKGVDVGLVFHMTGSYYRRKWDKLVLAAGDSDFVEPVKSLVEANGVDLHLIGSRSTMSNELISFSRSVIEIDKEPLHSELMLVQ
jgi:uncharacterized LabA/DUF88 family protein